MLGLLSGLMIQRIRALMDINREVSGSCVRIYGNQSPLAAITIQQSDIRFKTTSLRTGRSQINVRQGFQPQSPQSAQRKPVNLRVLSALGG
jgi:hypothetical protein